MYPYSTYAKERDFVRNMFSVKNYKGTEILYTLTTKFCKSNQKDTHYGPIHQTKTILTEWVKPLMQTKQRNGMHLINEPTYSYEALLESTG